MSGSFNNNYFGDYGSGYYRQLGATKCCNLTSGGPTGPTGPKGDIGPTGAASPSDSRDKTDIQSLEPSLDFLRALRPVRFTWNMRRDESTRGKAAVGFIAQEMLAAQDVAGHPVPGLVDETDPEYLLADYTRLIPAMARAIQELEARVVELEAAMGQCGCAKEKSID